MSFNIEVEGGKSVRLPTAGKYCDRDIVVTATGGVDDLSRQIIARTIESITDSSVETIGEHAFANCRRLTEVSCPNCTELGASAFYNATALVTANFPKVSATNNGTFAGCSALKNVNLPLLTRLRSNTFVDCTALEKIDLPACTNIFANVFSNCSMLTALILRSKCSLTSTSSFNGTPIENGTGYIYTHADLIDSYYRTATNWSTYQFRAIEDYPDICGG